jgi:lipopolysaccharide export system protein LptA
MKTSPLPSGLRQFLLLTSLLALQPAFAEKADKDKPVNLEADRITVDDAKKLHILEGNVVLVRGTLVIRTGSSSRRTPTV